MPNINFAEPVWQNTVSVSTLPALRGAVATTGGTPTVVVLQNDITLDGTQLTIPANAVIKLTSAGDAEYTLNANGASRVINVAANGTLYIDGINVTGGNYASNGGGIFVDSSTDGNMGRLYLLSGSIHDNYSSVSGGIYIYGGQFFMSGGNIYSNTANQEGGGVYIFDSTNAPYNSGFFLDGGAIYQNRTENYDGGGININNEANFIMNGGEVYGNTAYRNGGGIAEFAGQLTGTTTAKAIINGGDIYDNFANNAGVTYTSGGSLGGGGMIIYGTTEINGGNFYNNRSRGSGGAISIVNSRYSSLTITGGVFEDNQAGDTGGAIYSSSTNTLEISGETSFSGNQATNGGAIYTVYNNLSNLYVLSGVTFENNRASVAYNRKPADDALYLSHIFATRWTIPFSQGYNNYDIGYTNGTPVSNFCKRRYKRNEECEIKKARSYY